MRLLYEDKPDFLDDHDATVTPLRNLAREWLALVPALWLAMFRPLVRPSLGNVGRALLAWGIAVSGGISGSLLAGSLVVHFWSTPASGVLLAVLLVGAIVGASGGVLVWFLPFVILYIVIERWIDHDKDKVMMDAMNTADEVNATRGAETTSETDARDDANE